MIVQELPAGAGGTTYEGDAGFDVDCTTAQLLQGPMLMEDGAGAPIVTVAAEASGPGQSAMVNPIPHARNPFLISIPSPGPS